MKNATKYQKKIKKFLSGIRKSATPPPADQDRFHVMIDAILAAEAPNQSAKALDDLQKEFVDFNELRVSPVKEIVDALGRDFPDARRKAEEITSVLNAIFSSRNSMGLDYVEKMPKRDLRRHLHELGLSPFPAAVMMMQVFGGHAIPVDQGLVDCLEMDGYIEPGSSIEEVHAFLERIILQKQAPAAHEFFREYVAKNAKMLAKKRKAATVKAEALAAAEAAKAEAEAKAKAAAEAKKAQAKAKAEAEAKALAAAEARKRSARKRAAAKASAKSAAKSTKRVTARTKAQPKATKKAAKKATKKAVKKPTRKTKDK